METVKEHLMREEFLRGVSIPNLVKKFNVDVQYVHTLSSKWIEEHRMQQQAKKMLVDQQAKMIEDRLFDAIEQKMDKKIIDEYAHNYFNFKYYI
jgi:hypothetical protein